MIRYVGLDVSRKMTAICAVDPQGQRLWRDQCSSTPEQIAAVAYHRADADACLGIETGPMTPWLVHELRGRGGANIAPSMLDMHVSPSRCSSTRGTKMMPKGWRRSCAQAGIDRYM